MAASNFEFPVPQLSARLNQLFTPLCQAWPAAEAARLSTQVTAHVQAIEEALRKNEFLDLALAKNIAEALLRVLADYDQYPPPQQALIVGAARYFISEGDLEPDTSSVLGLDDDVAVLNFVLDTIGRADLKVEV